MDTDELTEDVSEEAPTDQAMEHLAVTPPSSTHPAGAVWPMAGGGIRQHGDPNPELNSAPSEAGNLQAGELDAEARARVAATVTQPATDVQADRADIGTE